MTGINDLVQDFSRTSRDRAVGASFFAMRRLHEILQRCLEVCDDLRLWPTTYMIKIYRY